MNFSYMKQTEIKFIFTETLNLNVEHNDITLFVTEHDFYIFNELTLHSSLLKHDF